jgi:hypothetical protein
LVETEGFVSEKIEPALTADEWRTMNIEGLVGTTYNDAGLSLELGQRKAALIALLNDALPLNDPRKFSHLDIEALRETARVEQAVINRALGGGTDNYIERIKRLADVLESYLRPENRR